MKKAILTPNPYRDKNFQTVREAAKVLRDAGMEVKLCLPFEVDKSYELPKDLIVRFKMLLLLSVLAAMVQFCIWQKLPHGTVSPF